MTRFLASMFLVISLAGVLGGKESALSKALSDAASVIYPESSVTPDNCKTSTEDTVCIDSTSCQSDNVRYLKRCGWNGLVPKVCCEQKKPVPGKMTSNLICGIQPTYVPSRLLRKKREDTGTILAIPGRPGNRPSVVGGEEVEPFSFPWMAAIDKKTYGTNYRFLCGATLISRRHILTAAHCFQSGDEKSPENFRVRLRAHLRTGGTSYDIQKIEIHPGYNYRENYNDIAILVLNTAVIISEILFSGSIYPICLPQAETSTVRNLTGSFADVLGWGHTSFGGVDSQVLLRAQLPIVSRDECDAAYRKVASRSFSKGITDDFLCAGYKEGGKDACQNDSGGPLQMLMDGKWFQIGIISFGYGCAEPGFPGVYTRVAHYVPWIDEIMSKPVHTR